MKGHITTVYPVVVNRRVTPRTRCNLLAQNPVWLPQLRPYVGTVTNADLDWRTGCTTVGLSPCATGKAMQPGNSERAETKVKRLRLMRRPSAGAIFDVPSVSKRCWLGPEAEYALAGRR